MLTPNHVRLLPAALVNLMDAAIFEELTVAIQAADDWPRMTALQRAVDENPRAFRACWRAMGR